MRGTKFQDFGPIELPERPKKKAQKSPFKPRLRKGEATRRKIIEAAKKVFSSNPYNTASIRMIGKVGGFDFTLIHHYFPTKKELFEAVGVELLEGSLLSNPNIIDGLETMPALQGLSEAFDRILGHSFANPAPEMVLIQNMAQLDRFKDIPGFEYLHVFHQAVIDLLKMHFFPEAPEKLLRMWQHCMVTITYSCIGAPAYPARIMGLDPTTPEYQQFVKDTLLFLFYPTLPRLLFPNEGEEEGAT